MQETFVSFPELRGHGIRASRVSVNKWMDLGIFPPSIRISPNRVGWSIFSIELFKASRPDAREPAPRLWPRRERPVKPVDPAKPVGRPKGSRVIRGPDGVRRLVRAEELAGEADAAA